MSRRRSEPDARVASRTVVARERLEQLLTPRRCRRTDGAVRSPRTPSAGRRQITPYASAASPSDSEEPASSASNSSSKPSVIVSRTADTL